MSGTNSEYENAEKNVLYITCIYLYLTREYIWMISYVYISIMEIRIRRHRRKHSHAVLLTLSNRGSTR